MDISRISVFIFDVNGVLIDSNRVNADAMASAFSEEGERREQISGLYMQLGGIDRGGKIRIIHERVFGRTPTETEFGRIWNSFGKLSRQSMLSAPAAKGGREVLAELGRRGKIRAALSNTPFDQLSEVLAGQGFKGLLDIVRGGGDWPKSSSLERFLKEFDFHPQDCLFLGDGKGDLAAARSSGVPFVGIDADRGEFTREAGVLGVYPDLAEWGKEAINFDPKLARLG